MEAPDGEDRYDEDHEIGHNVDDARADEYGVFIETVFSFGDFGAFADTFGGDC